MKSADWSPTLNVIFGGREQLVIQMSGASESPDCTRIFFLREEKINLSIHRKEIPGYTYPQRGDHQS